MLAEVGFWLCVSSLFGIISIWSFFPKFGAMGWPYSIFLVLLLVGGAIWFFFSLGKIQVWIKKRSTQYVLSLLVMAISSLVVIGFLNWGSVQLTEKGHWLKDYTKAKLYTLSDQTIDVLSSLKEKVKLEVWTTNLQSMGETRDMQTFLDGYQGHSKGMLTVEVINPQAKFLEANKAGIHRNNVIIVRALTSGREVRVENFEEKKGEEQITNAIISALKGQKKIICFLAGYGGPSLENREAEGLSFLKESLEGGSYQTKEISLGTLEKVPAECEMLALVGPHGAANERDLKMIRETAQTGVPLLAFIGATSGKGWRDLTKEFGVTVREDLILNPLRPNSPQVVDTANYARDIDIVKGFRLRTAHFAVSSLVLPPVARQGDTTIRAFVSTEGRAYAKKVDLSKKQNIDLRRSNNDLTGALPIAVLIEKGIQQATAPNPTPQKPKAVAPKKIEPPKTSKLEWILNSVVPTASAQENPGDVDGDMSFEETSKNNATAGQKKMRIILFSSDMFLSNALIEQGGNRDLVLNSIGYLLQDSNSLGIRPREIGEVRLDIKPYDDRKVFGALFLVSLVFMFFAVRAAGRKARLGAA